MKFILPEPQAPMDDCDELRVGNVYACKGGNKTRYWIVVGIAGASVALIGINTEGIVTSATSYGAHVFNGTSSFVPRKVLGRVEGLDELNFDITWREQP